MHRARWFTAVAFALVGLLAASSASARIEVVSWSHVMPCSVDGFELRYGTSPGTLDNIVDVGRPRQAGAHFSYELDVPENQEIYVCVAAVLGQLTSACSNQVTIETASEDEQLSQPAPEEDQRTWCEDFTDGSRGPAWIDTAADSSLQGTSGMFDVAAVDGDIALTTDGPDNGIHSHFLGADLQGTPATQWSAYEYSGEMQFSEAGGGVGVTLYSRYNVERSYYRLGRQPLTGTFRLERDQIDPSWKCVAAGQAVYVVPGEWYAFRVQAQDEATQTTLQAKVWRSDESEPSGFQWLCTDIRPNRQLAGAIGVWSTGSGAKAWDSLHVANLPVAGLGAPGKPELVP